MDTTTRAVRFLKTVTHNETEYVADTIYDLPAELALHFVARENAAEWHQPRRPCPTNGEFLSTFDPPHLRGREMA